MNESENHTLAWMRRIDGKVDAMAGDSYAVGEWLDRIEDELIVTSAICVRLESREVDGKCLLALNQRIQAGQRRLEKRVAAVDPGTSPAEGGDVVLRSMGRRMLEFKDCKPTYAMKRQWPCRRAPRPFHSTTTQMPQRAVQIPEVSSI